MNVYSQLGYSWSCLAGIHICISRRDMNGKYAIKQKYYVLVTIILARTFLNN